MRAISLWQPWATAIAVGIKKVETRHWPAPAWAIGPVAIHASKKYEADQRYFTGELFARGLLPSLNLPFGALVAVAHLDIAWPTERVVPSLDETELMLGDYTPGRFAWMLSHITPLPEPIPFRGAQGFFPVPDDLIPIEFLTAVGL